MWIDNEAKTQMKKKKKEQISQNKIKRQKSDIIEMNGMMCGCGGYWNCVIRWGNSGTGEVGGFHWHTQILNFRDFSIEFVEWAEYYLIYISLRKSHASVREKEGEK